MTKGAFYFTKHSRFLVYEPSTGKKKNNLLELTTAHKYVGVKTMHILANRFEIITSFKHFRE